jgi:hypothetical protein
VREIRLVDLLVAPLDVVYFAPGELEQRFILACRRTRPAGIPAEAEVRLDFSRAPTWATTIFSVDEFLEAVASVRRFIANGRPLNADDLTLPELGSAPGIDLVELKARTDSILSTVRRVQTDLQAWVAAPAPVDLNVGRDTLLRAAHVGISSAVPTFAPSDDPAELASLRELAASILADLGRRLAATSAVVATPGQPDGDLERMRALLGRDFVVLPRFRAANVADLTTAFGASLTLQGNDPLAANTWLTRMAFVRDGAARLNDTLRSGEAVTGGSPPLAVAQLPFAAGDRWVALPPAAGQVIPPGRLSLVACAPAPVDPSQPLAGLAIDEWSEVVPSRSEATGLAFNYDAPGSRPPQTILLAVAPDLTQAWNLDTLEAILLETLELAKLRLVDPDAMQELDQYLPAMYFALNAAGDTVSTRLID